MRRLFDYIPLGGLWILLVLICLGLGYPTLNRYDSRISGNTDSAEYYSIMELPALRPLPSANDDSPRPRVLVPFVARVFYRLVRGHTGSADAGFFGLLLANSIFVAATALILIDLGTRIIGSVQVALLAATFYLLSFAVSNYLLSGLVDSGEACAILLLAWAMYTGRWYLLPIIGVFGAAAKETFLPFSAAFTFAWWVTSTRWTDLRWPPLLWVVAKDVVVLATLIILWSVWYGHLILPWDIARAHQKDTSFLAGLWGCISSHELFYVFGWLGAFGIWRLRRLPLPWVVGAAASAFLALNLGAWDDSQGNISRAMFNLVGPVLSLSVAVLVTEIAAGRSARQEQ